MFCPKCGMQNPDDARFCANCGAQLPAAEMYEEELNDGGTDRVDAQPDDVQPEYTNAGRGQDASSKGGGSKPPHTERAPLSKKTKGLIGGICAAAVVLVIVIIALVVLMKPTINLDDIEINLDDIETNLDDIEINLDDYIEITFEGWNTIGSATVELDTHALAADYEEELQDRYADSLDWEDLSAQESEIYTQAFVRDCVSYSVDPGSSLSNGDTVTLTWDCDDDTALALYGVNLIYSEQTLEVTGLKDADITYY